MLIYTRDWVCLSRTRPSTNASTSSATMVLCVLMIYVNVLNIVYYLYNVVFQEVYIEQNIINAKSDEPKAEHLYLEDKDHIHYLIMLIIFIVLNFVFSVRSKTQSSRIGIYMMIEWIYCKIPMVSKFYMNVLNITARIYTNIVNADACIYIFSKLIRDIYEIS